MCTWSEPPEMCSVYTGCISYSSLRIVFFTACSVQNESGVVHKIIHPVNLVLQRPCRHKRRTDEIMIQHAEGRVRVWQKIVESRHGLLEA